MLSNLSKIESIALLPETEREKFLSSLTEKETEELLYSWDFQARPNQLPPSVDWYIWLITSGRGGGKTRTGAELIIKWAHDFSPIALVGETKADVRDVMVELGDSSIIKVSSPWFRPEYEPSKRRVTWPNGAHAVIYSGDDPDQLRGPQHAKAWIDELAKFQYPQQCWDNLMFGLRVGIKPQVVITTTPRPIAIIKSLAADKRCIRTRVHTLDNKANLAEGFLNFIMDRYEGTELGKQELAGEILEDVAGSLWKRAYIKYKALPTRTEKLRDEHGNVTGETQIPDVKRIVVSIDPAVTSNQASDETGIIVAAQAVDNNYYVIADLSGKFSPDAWARRACAAYLNYSAHRVIAEVNQGGDLVKATLRTVDPNVPLKTVHARTGKYTRAEPIAALYEQGKVFHVKNFPDLEDQLCTWTPDSGVSPDRLDALVYALTELSGRGQIAFAVG